MGLIGRLSNRMKRVGKSKTIERNYLDSSIQCIPNEVLGEVFARVASSSFHDILNAMLSCKNFREVGNDDYIYKHVSLEKFPLSPWKKNDDTAVIFFDRCRDNQNPEALYRQGVIDYFSSVAKAESGLESLKKSANSGHLGALYAVGIISLLSEFDIERQLGMQILISMAKSKSRKNVRQCRENLNEILNYTWIRKDVNKQRPRCCLKLDRHIPANTGFPEVDSDGEYDKLPCDACECDRELSSVYF